MSYGGMLTDASGVPFYIDGTMPLTLLEKRVVTSVNGLGSYDLVANDGTLRLIFLQAADSDFTTPTNCEWLVVENGLWRLYTNGSPRTINVFIFGYAVQPVPAWGIQINNSAGQCILTNETRPLRDVQSFGDISSDSTSGYFISTTLSGSWAIAPQATGVFTAVDIGSGQARPVQAWYYGVARYNGTQTILRSAYRGSNTGTNLQNPSYINSRTKLTAINVARY